MPTVRGKSDVKRFIAQLPGNLERNVLRGAARAAGNVVAEEAKSRSVSDEVSSAIKVATSSEDGRVIAKVQVKGKGSYLGPWLEYGTDPHFISVDDSQRNGMSVRRINQNAKDGSLVIGGKFVGATVFHPGARPHPFLRPALDIKENEAVAAAQAYINRRVASGDIESPDSLGDDE